MDRDRTMVIVMTRDGRENIALRRYLLQRFPADAVFAPSDSIQAEQLIVARNRVMHEMVLRSRDRFQHFVLMDDDLLPDDRLDPMWEQPGDVVGAEYAIESRSAWLRPTDVHCSCLRFTRQVAETLAPPYFKFTYNGTLTACLSCECNWFRDRALEAGFTVARAGYADHGNLRRWCGR